MTRQFWTRFITTSLILLGNSVFASEISQRSDTEVTTFLSNVQASPAEFLDNTNDEWQAALTGAIPEKSSVDCKYLTFSLTTNSITQPPKYNRYNPRAPPIFSL